MKIEFFGRRFVRLPLTDRGIGSKKGILLFLRLQKSALRLLVPAILHFTFTEIGYPTTGPGDLKFITDSLPLYWLNETFLTEKIRSVNDVRQCHATGNERIHKENQFYTPEKVP